MYCKNCGQQINIDSRFCKNCGTEVLFNKFSIIKIRFLDWIKNYKKVFIIIGLIIVGILIVTFFNKYSFLNLGEQITKTNNFNPASSVVNILCTAKNSGQGSAGSGIIISKDGLILTNAHIIPQINEAPSVLDDSCLVVLPDEITGKPKEIYFAEPKITKGFSKEYDIATLQINSVYTDENGKSWGVLSNNFPEFRDNSDCEEGLIELGDSVKIYGYPVTSGGYNLTITEGIVSSFNDDGTILTSAKIDSGNSGGLAIDQNECFIGIPSAIVEGNYQNLGVIIPPNLIKDFIDNVPYQYQSNNTVLTCDVNECYFDGKCISRPANSYCVSDDLNNAWKCNDGYVESGNYCVKPKTNTDICRDNFGWNTYWDGTYCQCNDGYVWNKSKSACISRTEGCQESWSNTYWDGTFSSTGKYTCDCISGYVWNVTKDACVTKSSIDQACQKKYGYYSYYLGYTEDGKYMCYSSF